jgi:polyisoprenoid-binding protein YceI
MKTAVMKFVLLAICGLWAWPALAQDWKLDSARSQLRFVVKQMNVPVEGGFARFDAQARFEPAHIEAGQFRVEVDVASIDTGSSDGDAEAKRPGWFDTARYAKALFVSKSVRKAADGSYLATGDLTVKGQTRPVQAVFKLGRQAAGWLADGRFILRRSDFGIGGGDWNGVVANEVEVRFRLALLP